VFLTLYVYILDLYSFAFIHTSVLYFKRKNFIAKEIRVFTADLKQNIETCN